MPINTARFDSRIRVANEAKIQSLPLAAISANKQQHDQPVPSGTTSETDAQGSTCDFNPVHKLTTAADDQGADVMSDLSNAIERLWALDQSEALKLKLTRDERKRNRVELAKCLIELKGLLVGRGKEGEWLPFLRKHGIGRSTAESIIKRAIQVSVQSKRSKMFAELTVLSIPKLLRSIRTKLAPLNTPELVAVFVQELTIVLDAQVDAKLAEKWGTVGPPSLTDQRAPTTSQVISSPPG